MDREGSAEKVTDVRPGGLKVQLREGHSCEGLRVGDLGCSKARRKGESG